MSNKLSLTLCKNKELKTHIDTFLYKGKEMGKVYCIMMQLDPLTMMENGKIIRKMDSV